LKDADTADLFTEVSRGIDKLLWMVEAHVQMSAGGPAQKEMATTDHYDVLVIGSGEAGTYLAWTLSAQRPSHGPDREEDDRRLVSERRLSTQERVRVSAPNVPSVPNVPGVPDVPQGA
jgi:hypothetical protein